MTKTFSKILLSALIGIQALPAGAATLSERLSGQILLQVEEKGKAWYLEPSTGKRAYLGRPADAFRVMRELGLGIANADLERIGIAGEVMVGDVKLARKLAGKILLQVQGKGEAWYINPRDFKRYYLGRPQDAFSVMRSLGQGISNADLQRIPVRAEYHDPAQELPPVQAKAEEGQKPGSPAATTKQPTTDFTKYAGSYRCWSYNVSGGGGSDCRLFAPIVLNTDGTYAVSSEKGTYAVDGDVISLSESKIRGKGKLIGGTQIRFEYDYNGWHHTITYLKESGAPFSTEGALSEIPVQIILEYPSKDSSLGSIATVELVQEGQDIKKAAYKPTAIAVWDGDKRVTASFHKATNTPQTGKKYTVYANYGGEAVAVGSIDLVDAKEQMTATIKVSGGAPAKAEQKTVELPEGQEIVVEINLVYPERDSSLGSIQTVILVPEGQDPATAVYQPTALAVWDGDRTVAGSFHKPTNQVKTKAKYSVYVDWGREKVKSATLDLTTTAAGPVQKTFQTTISGSSTQSSGTPSSSSSQTPQTSTSQSSQPTQTSPTTTSQTQTDQSSLPLCNPNIPKYSQPPCRE